MSHSNPVSERGEGPCRIATAFGTAALPALLASAILVVACIAATAAQAEPGWIRASLKINLRSGPGTQHTIVGVVETGNSVEYLDKTEGFVKVRTESGTEGWIPETNLDRQAPAQTLLQQAEDAAASLRARLEASDATIADVTARNEEFRARDEARRLDADRMAAEANELRANRRWPEWITGASVLAAGMLLGAILHRSSQRRPQARIRL